MERWILHCDCNSFFASVEYAMDPSLGTGPLAVAGDPKIRHGIILAKNEAAKRAGVQTAETVWQAKRKCPDLKLVPAHYEAYERYSVAINRIYRKYTDLVEPFSIDESYLDVSGTLHLFDCDAKELADRIRAQVRRETGITISVGVSFNKTFAKLGSDMKKPDATTFLPRESVAEKIWPLDVSELLYVGRSCREKLEKMNIRTIGELAAADRNFLSQQLGKAGISLSKAARGEEDDPVVPPEEGGPTKSIGNGLTFAENLETPEQVRRAVLMLAEGVAARLRVQNHICKTVQITWKTPDLTTKCKQCAVNPPSRLTDCLTNLCMEMLQETGAMRQPLRALTVTAQNLIAPEDYCDQMSFFDDKREKQEKKEKLEEAFFTLRDRFGKSAVKRARLMDKEEPKREILPFHGPKNISEATEETEKAEPASKFAFSSKK